jgi:hypothetical protein
MEMLTASLLLATVLLAVGMVYPRGMSAITASSDRARASSLAQKKLEELFEAATSGRSPEKLREGSYEDQPDPRFTRTWSVMRDRREHAIADLTVTVSWEQSRSQRSVTLRTLVAVREIRT